MDPTEIDALILALANRAGGIVTSRQMQAAGLNRTQINRRTGRLLTALTDGVYGLGPLTADMKLRGALLALPRAVVAFGSAGVRQRLPLPPHAIEEATVLVTGYRSRRRIDGVDICFTRWLPAADVTSADGLRVTTVARTLCDLSTRYPARRLQHLMEHALSERLTTATELQASILGWCRRGRSGTATLRRVGQILLDGDPIPASELERRAFKLLRQAGLPPWTAQYRPPWYDGLRGAADIAWPEARLLVELDGRRWHATNQAQAEDRRRDRLAASDGWLTVRFGWQEIVERPSVVVEEIRHLLATRLSPTR